MVNASSRLRAPYTSGDGGPVGALATVPLGHPQQQPDRHGGSGRRPWTGPLAAPPVHTAWDESGWEAPGARRPVPPRPRPAAGPSRQTVGWALGFAAAAGLLVSAVLVVLSPGRVQFTHLGRPPAASGTAAGTATAGTGTATADPADPAVGAGSGTASPQPSTPATGATPTPGDQGTAGPPTADGTGGTGARGFVAEPWRAADLQLTEVLSVRDRPGGGLSLKLRRARLVTGPAMLGRPSLVITGVVDRSTRTDVDATTALYDPDGAALSAARLAETVRSEQAAGRRVFAWVGATGPRTGYLALQRIGR